MKRKKDNIKVCLCVYLLTHLVKEKSRWLREAVFKIVENFYNLEIKESF